VAQAVPQTLLDAMTQVDASWSLYKEAPSPGTQAAYLQASDSLREEIYRWVDAFFKGLTHD
jgi:hypothetical protein